MLRSHFRENWFSLRSSIQHFHRKMNSWTMPNIPIWLPWILLFKRAQVYKMCSIADALKTGERNPIQRAFDHYLSTFLQSSNSLKHYEDRNSKVFSFICSLGATDQSAKRYFWKDYCFDLHFAITPWWGFAYFLVISKIYVRATVWRISTHENERKRNQINMQWVSKRTRA